MASDPSIPFIAADLLSAADFDARLTDRALHVLGPMERATPIRQWPVVTRTARALTARRTLRVIGDIACDPDSAFNPVPVYDAVTSWEAPVRRVHDDPPLDVMAIDNLPSMLPLESSEDYAAQLLPTLLALKGDPEGVWSRAEALFHHHLTQD